MNKELLKIQRRIKNELTNNNIVEMIGNQKKVKVFLSDGRNITYFKRAALQSINQIAKAQYTAANMPIIKKYDHTI